MTTTTKCFIPIGLHCTATWGVRDAGLRTKSYAFDYIWCPAVATYEVLKRLITENVDAAIKYMVTGYEYYDFHGKGIYTLTNKVSGNQMNKHTGIGVTHFTINQEYGEKLKIRFQRIIDDIKTTDKPYLIYADAASEEFNYTLDGVPYDHNVTEYLDKIYQLLLPLNANLHVLYFCQKERYNDSYTYITHIPHKYAFYVEKMVCEYLKEHHRLEIE